MKKFIGAKIVQAKPAVRVSGEDFKNIIVAEGEPMPQGVTLAENGYRVVYEDGYVSWCPEDVFEKAYRPTDGLNFGLAHRGRQDGQEDRPCRVERQGSVCGAGHLLPVHLPLRRCPQVYLRPAHGYRQRRPGVRGHPWPSGGLASQADMLADDWRIVE